MSSPDPSEQDEFLVSRYLDGALDEDERRAFEHRLNGDPRIAALVQQYRTVDALVRRAAAEVPQVDWGRFEAEFRRRRAASDAASRRSVRFIRVFAPLAAAAAIAITFSLLYRPATEPGGGGTGAIVSTVEVDRPTVAEPVIEESVVVYSYNPVLSFDAQADDEPARPVIALAAVGGDIHWPALPYDSSGQHTQ